MAINLSKGVNLFTPNDGDQVIGTISPTDFNTQGFNRQGDESGFFIKTIADGDGQMDPNHTLKVWFYYPTTEKWKEHLSISYDNPQIEAHPGLNGHAVAWVSDVIEGQPNIAYIETNEAEVRIHQIKHAIITDHDVDNNSQQTGLVGQQKNSGSGGVFYGGYTSNPSVYLDSSLVGQNIILQNVDHSNGGNSQNNYIGENGSEYIFIPLHSYFNTGLQITDDMPRIKCTMTAGYNGENTFQVTEVFNIDNHAGLPSSGNIPEGGTASQGDVFRWLVYDVPGLEHNLTEDFISWYSNDITQGVPGLTNQQIVNYDGYQRVYLDLSSKSIGDTYECTVDGNVDDAILFTRMNEKQDCVFTYDSKTKKSTISFEIPAGDNGDYSTTLDRWHVWYSLGEVLQEPFKMTIGLYNSANQVGNYIPNITMPQGPLGINFMGSVGGASTTTTPILLSNALVGTDLELVHSGSPIPAIGENVKLVPYHSTMINASTNGALTVEPDAPMLHCTIIRTYQSNFKVKINSVSNITNWTNLPSGTNQNVGEVFRWRMYEAGTSTFDFPLIMKSGEDFSINVNWGDGNEEALTQSDFQTYTNQSGFSTHLGSPFFNDSVGTTFKGETDVLYYMHTYQTSGDATIEIRADHLPLAYGHALEDTIQNLSTNITEWDDLRNIQLSTYDNYNYLDASIMAAKYHIKSIDQWGEVPFTILDHAFARCVNMDLKAIDVPLFGENANLTAMFKMCSNKFINSTYSIINWKTENVTNMSQMFCGTSSFNKPLNTNSRTEENEPPYLVWNTENVKNFSQMFAGMSSFGQSHGFNMPINRWNMMSAENLTGMFQYSRFNRDIPFSNIAADYYYLGSPAYPAWFFGTQSTSFNLSYMFKDNSTFDSSVEGWFLPRNTDQTVYVNGMFKNAFNFNQPIVTQQHSAGAGEVSGFSYSSSWRGDRIFNASEMFYGAGSFNQAVGGLLSTTNICVTTAAMFKNASKFNNGTSTDIDLWNTSNVTVMQSMFENCSLFNRSIISWDVSNVTHFQSMFEDAVWFNQSFGGLNNGWDTTAGQRFDSMFESAKHFNQALYFDLSNAYSANSFLKNASLYSQQMYVTFGNGSQSIGPQGGVQKDPTNAQYLYNFISGTNYSTSLVNGLLTKLVQELRNLNTITHVGHLNYSASDGNTYEGNLEGLPSPHEANSPAATARFGLIQNGWWVEDNTVVTPVANNISFDITGWSDNLTFSENTLVNAQIGTTFSLIDADGNFNGADFTLEWTGLTNINGDARSMSAFELISQYGGSAFAIKLKEGFIYDYNSSWDDNFIFEFKISTPNGSFRNVTRTLALTNEKPDGVTVGNMIDLGSPARGTNLLTSASTTTLNFSGAWNTTPYGILKPKWPGSGAGIYGTYGGQYLGAAITVEGMPNYKDDFQTQLGLGNGAFDANNLPPTWPNVVAGPYIHIKRSRFNNENDQEHFDNYALYIANISDWVNGAAANDGVNLKEGVAVELVGVDMDLGWWVQSGNNASQGATQSNYFCEFRSSPLPPQARAEIQGSPDDNGLFGFLDPSFDGFSNRKYGEAHPSNEHHGSDFNGTWHNINKRGWKDVTNKFQINKNLHTNPITGENQDHWELSYIGDDVDNFPSSKHFPDNFEQTQSENDFWSHSSFSHTNHPQNSYPFYVPRIYQTEFGDTVTNNYWRKGVQFTIWYRFKDASLASSGAAYGVGSETDDNGLYSGTLKKICLVVRDNLK